MKIDGWKYYSRAAIPATPPHVSANLLPIEDQSIWKLDGNPLLARWTADWDCQQKTNWWYVIKDTPFDINELKAKRRYEIKKGNKNFVVREIDPAAYAEELFHVAQAAYETYPKSYRPSIERNSYMAKTKNWNFYKTYGAFYNKDSKLAAFANLRKDGKYIDFINLKAVPTLEKQGVNAAIIYKILDDHQEFLTSGGYICDGARSINHETAFQDYLEKYFQFRKAYCHLNIAYKKEIAVLVKLAWPFRTMLYKWDTVDMVHKLNAVLKMEEIVRKSNE